MSEYFYRACIFSVIASVFIPLGGWLNQLKYRQNKVVNIFLSAFSASSMILISFFEIIEYSSTFLKMIYNKYLAGLIIFLICIISLIIISSLDKFFLKSISNINEKYNAKIAIILIALFTYSLPQGLAVFSNIYNYSNTSIIAVILISISNIVWGMYISKKIYIKNKFKMAMVYLIAILSQFMAGIIILEITKLYSNVTFYAILYSFIAIITLYMGIYKFLVYSFSYKREKITYFGILFGFLLASSIIVIA